MVSYAAAVSERLHSPRSWGTTAEAKNQIDIDKTSVIASSARARHLPAACSDGSVIAGALGTARIRAQ